METDQTGFQQRDGKPVIVETRINYSEPGSVSDKMATKRDREILNAIVNPLLPVGEAVFDDEEKLPQNLKDVDELDTKLYR